MKKHIPNPNNEQNLRSERVSDTEVQSQISNADRLDQIAEQLGFDALKDSTPVAFVRDWINQFSGMFGFGSATNNIRQHGSDSSDNLSANGGLNKNNVLQSGRKGHDHLDVIGGKKGSDYATRWSRKRYPERDRK